MSEMVQFGFVVVFGTAKLLLGHSSDYVLPLGTILDHVVHKFLGYGACLLPLGVSFCCSSSICQKRDGTCLDLPEPKGVRFFGI